MAEAADAAMGRALDLALDGKSRPSLENKGMSRDEAEAVVAKLYRLLLRREPGGVEHDAWAGILERGAPVSELLDRFGESAEFVRQHEVAPFFPAGHYYSPIVKPDAAVKNYMAAQRGRVGATPHGIPIDLTRMHSFIRSNRALMNPQSVSETPRAERRYFSENGGFPAGDALVLRAMINHARPNRVIEVGSGFSTACMLDVFDEIGHQPMLMCIDPFPDRLRSLLRETDKVEIIASPVQDVPIAKFEELGRGDILFIDSTHVVKTGSDVHFELFEILPRLRAGVFVHFHDIVYPFEYPTQWVFDNNYSWNEAYFLRAFLMYNQIFSVFFSSSYLSQLADPLLRRFVPEFPSNPGTNMWLVKEQ